MKQKLSAFFYGRYGADDLAKATLILYIVVSAATVFIGNYVVRLILNGISLLICILMFYRMLSRNTLARAEENRRYLLWRRNAKQWFLLRRNKWKYRKTHVYRGCPHCGAQIRLPRVTGNHQCDCPKCKERFSVNIK